MGIDVDGGMIVGLQGEDIAAMEWCYEDYDTLYEYLEMDLGMESMSPNYDCDPEYCVWGYRVDDVSVNLLDLGKWTTEVIELGSKFQGLTGLEPKLIGMQDIT